MNLKNIHLLSQNTEKFNRDRSRIFPQTGFSSRNGYFKKWPHNSPSCIVRNLSSCLICSLATSVYPDPLNHNIYGWFHPDTSSYFCFHCHFTKQNPTLQKCSHLFLRLLEQYHFAVFFFFFHPEFRFNFTILKSDLPSNNQETFSSL